MTARLDWDTDGRDWPHRSASQFVEVAGLTWHVQRFGQGPLILLVHGTAASTHSWRGLAPILATTNSVLSLDLPGHAFSGPLPGRTMSVANVSSAVGALLRKLEVNPDLAVGHSAGAAILVRMCRDGLLKPRNGIVSLNGALLPFEGFPKRLFLPLAKVLSEFPLTANLFSWRASDVTAVERVIAGTGSQLDASGLDLYARLFRNPHHVATALNMMANWNLDTMVDDIARLEWPLHLVACGEDLAVPPDTAFRIQKQVPNIGVTYVRNLGHLGHEEKPGTISNIISARLEATSAARDTSGTARR